MTTSNTCTGLEPSGALGHLVEAADSLLGHGTPDRSVSDAVAGRLEQVLSQVLQDPGLLPEGITSCRPPDGFGKYLLHAAPGFVVFSTVTAPGIAAPIHDHGSWGLVGLYRGAEEEVRYLLEPGSSADHRVRLEELGRTAHTSGDVVVIEPPPDDIHQVFNRGSSHSVVVHLFLGDYVRSGFRFYDPPECTPWPTGPLQYDPIPVERPQGVR